MFVLFRVKSEPHLSSYDIGKLFTITFSSLTNQNERKSISIRLVLFQKLNPMPIFSISTVTFSTPGKVLIFSVTNNRKILLSQHLFLVKFQPYQSRTKCQEIKQLKKKYVFIGPVLLIGMGENFGSGEVNFHTLQSIP